MHFVEIRSVTGIKLGLKYRVCTRNFLGFSAGLFMSPTGEALASQGRAFRRHVGYCAESILCSF